MVSIVLCIKKKTYGLNRLIWDDTSPTCFMPSFSRARLNHLFERIFAEMATPSTVQQASSPLATRRPAPVVRQALFAPTLTEPVTRLVLRGRIPRLGPPNVQNVRKVLPALTQTRVRQ